MSTQHRISVYAHDGLTFDVRDEGPIDGEVVVLLHGFPQTSTSWQHVTPLLHEQGYRTLAPDLRGYSPGARPRGRRAYRTDLLVADVAALLALVGSPVHLVGHDWGAVLSWGVAIGHPDLVRTHTSLSVPHPSAFISSMGRSPQLLRSWYMGFFQLPVIPEALITRFPGVLHRALAFTGMDREARERVIEEVVQGGALTGGLNFYRGLPLSLSSVGGRCTVPTTHVWSTGDDALDRKGAELCEKYVSAPYRLEVVDGASHWLPDQEPATVARIIVQRAREHA
ncbi:alpha/beta fold hydrolase [Aeromicrobium sp. CTD01-1L150]|uniref:alpha/beta fold hydrolase n=1 Tax=Aeromicrobium sp. CTD01-1L150 TaxID=3341830 RepID=UPI0035C1641D